MINLLTTSEQRRLQFAEILSNKDNWTTLADLAHALNCSVRVLKDDITYLRKNFSDFKVETSNQGVRLNFKHDKGLKSLYRSVLNESTAYQLLEIIFIYEGKSIAELSELLFVSTSTLYRLIDQINEEISKYDFKIKTSPCRVIGKEEHIRYFYYQYFFEKYSYLEWPYKTIDEEALDKLLLFFIEFTEIPADFAFYNVFKLVSLVNLIRYKNGHFVDTKDILINFDEIIPDLSMYAEEFKFFEEALQVKMNTELINQMFTPYVQEGFSLSPERLIAKAENDQKLAVEIDFLGQILTKISKDNSIHLPNKNLLILAMNNAAHLEYQEPQSGYILYNRNKYFADMIARDFPKFHKQLYEGMDKYRKFIGKPITEDGINFFIYTLFTFWDNLVPELRKKFEPIRAVVISDRHITHGHMLKDFIAHEFTEQIVIDIYTGTELNKNILENLDCDFIVTNFPIPKLKSKRTVYIENVPIFNDLVKLQTVIDSIIAERINP